jgi:hypothetical protein
VKPKSSALLVASAVHLGLKYWNKARWQGESPTKVQISAYALLYREATVRPRFLGGDHAERKVHTLLAGGPELQPASTNSTNLTFSKRQAFQAESAPAKQQSA